MPKNNRRALGDITNITDRGPATKKAKLPTSEELLLTRKEANSGPFTNLNTSDLSGNHAHQSSLFESEIGENMFGKLKEPSLKLSLNKLMYHEATQIVARAIVMRSRVIVNGYNIRANNNEEEENSRLTNNQPFNTASLFNMR